MICILIQFFIFLFGCSNFTKNNDIISDFNFSAENADKIVNIYDYKTIHLPLNYVQVSNQDIETVINNDLSYYEQYKQLNKNIVEKDDVVLLQTKSNDKDYCLENYYYTVGSADCGEDFDSSITGAKINDSIVTTVYKNVELTVKIKGIYTFATFKDTDIVCSYYKMDNMDDVYRMIEERTKNEIISNYMYERILENSYFLSSPSVVDTYLKNYISEIKKEAQREGISIEEFARQKSGTSLNDMLAYRRQYYNEIILMNVILAKENKSISINDLDNSIKLTARENELSENEVSEKYIEDVYYNLLYKKTKEAIVGYIIIDQ